MKGGDEVSGERLSSSEVTGLKNQALHTDENGTKYSRCVKCEAYIGNEYTMDYYALISRKYCDRCQAEVRAEQKAAYMRRKRQNAKLVKQKNAKLTRENEELRVKNAELDSMIAELIQENKDLKSQRKKPLFGGCQNGGFFKHKT